MIPTNTAIEKIRYLFRGLSKYTLWHIPVLGLQAFSIASAPPEAIFKALNEQGIQLHLLQQVHGCRYANLADGASTDCDAWLWAHNRNLVPPMAAHMKTRAYGIYTADCIPALLYMEYMQWQGGALIHLGRKGIELGLLVKCYRALIQRLEKLQRKEQKLKKKAPEENNKNWPIRLFLGPGIGACCYEIPNSMAEDFCHHAQVSSVHCCRNSIRTGYQMLDLRQAICEQAQTLLQIQEPTYIENLCTSCQAQAYRAGRARPCYSYRQGHKTERLYTIIRFDV